MLSLQVLQKQGTEKKNAEPMKNTALTTDITERDKQGLNQRMRIIGMYVFLKLCTQIIQLQLSAGLHNRNTVGQIWPNVFSVSD